MDKTRLDPSSAQKIESVPTGAASTDRMASPRPSLQKTGPRKLVLCFDGTGNKFHGDDSDSNILKIFRMLDRTANDQYHYYQPGIGTYVVSGSLTHTSIRARINSWYTKAKDSAIGSSFDQHVVSGYRFLMRFYNPGDEIYMFGFSRGAYIARFLAEMLDYIGLLSHGNEEMVKFAWKAFSQWQCRSMSSGSEEEVAEGDEEKKKMFKFMKGFRETFSRPVGRIRFLGLFDTVNSVPRFETAWMQRSKFPYTARSSAKVIRHAVSIDERRAKFRQDLMYQAHPKKQKEQQKQGWFGMESWYPRQHQSSIAPQKETEEQTNGQKNGVKQSNGVAQNPEDRGRQRQTSNHRYLSPHPKGQHRKPSESNGAYRPHSKSRLNGKPQQQEKLLRPGSAHSEVMSHHSNLSHADLDPAGADDDQDIDEVWFAGGHADVGGGWEVLEDRKAASHVPLAWIVREAMRAGLPFDAEKVAEMGCSCAAEWEEHNPSKRRAKYNRNSEKGAGAQTPLPDIRFDNGDDETQNGDGHDGNNHSIAPDSESDDEPELTFQYLMNKAHTARIHDSLAYKQGLGTIAVSAWKFMEYVPFRRMDLKSDGSWAPIRWPLPRGEVRDIPENVRVHGSVLRRMRDDSLYRPGNLIIGGGGRGVKIAPEEYGIGEWVCVAEEGDAIGEIWMRKDSDGNE